MSKVITGGEISNQGLLAKQGGNYASKNTSIVLTNDESFGQNVNFRKAYQVIFKRLFLLSTRNNPTEEEWSSKIFSEILQVLDLVLVKSGNDSEMEAVMTRNIFLSLNKITTANPVTIKWINNNALIRLFSTLGIDGFVSLTYTQANAFFWLCRPICFSGPENQEAADHRERVDWSSYASSQRYYNFSTGQFEFMSFVDEFTLPENSGSNYDGWKPKVEGSLNVIAANVLLIPGLRQCYTRLTSKAFADGEEADIMADPQFTADIQNQSAKVFSKTSVNSASTMFVGGVNKTTGDEMIDGTIDYSQPPFLLPSEKGTLPTSKTYYYDGCIAMALYPLLPTVMDMCRYYTMTYNPDRNVSTWRNTWASVDDPLLPSATAIILGAANSAGGLISNQLSSHIESLRSAINGFVLGVINLMNGTTIHASHKARLRVNAIKYVVINNYEGVHTKGMMDICFANSRMEPYSELGLRALFNRIPSNGNTYETSGLTFINEAYSWLEDSDLNHPHIAHLLMADLLVWKFFMITSGSNIRATPTQAAYKGYTIDYRLGNDIGRTVISAPIPAFFGSEMNLMYHYATSGCKNQSFPYILKNILAICGAERTSGLTNPRQTDKNYKKG